MILRYAFASLVILSLSVSVFAQQVSKPGEFVSRGAVTMPKTQQFDVTSKSGRPYRLFVAEPLGPAPAAGYPILYVLDANSCFSSVVEATRTQSRRFGETGVSDAIIVGLGYQSEQAIDGVARTYDYMTEGSPEKLPPMRGGKGWPPSGGAEEFYEFIEETVKPEMAKRYKVDPKRQAIFGHSFGGYFVLYTLFRHPESYQTYLAASPSTWWNDYGMIEMEKAFYENQNEPSPKPRLLMTAGTEEKGGPASQLPPTRNSTEFGTLKDFAARLNRSKKLAGDVQLEIFQGANHGATLNLTLQPGIPFAFKKSE
ncbi:alpha/beta hydrolase [Lacunimicrobium album]